MAKRGCLLQRLTARPSPTAPHGRADGSDEEHTAPVTRPKSNRRQKPRPWLTRAAADEAPDHPEGSQLTPEGLAHVLLRKRPPFTGSWASTRVGDVTTTGTALIHGAPVAAAERMLIADSRK